MARPSRAEAGVPAVGERLESLAQVTVQPAYGRARPCERRLKFVGARGTVRGAASAGAQQMPCNSLVRSGYERTSFEPLEPMPWACRARQNVRLRSCGVFVGDSIA